MKVIYGLGNKRLGFKKVVATIGVFDGVHIGHQQIIQKTISLAKKEEAKSLVITFWPHPIKVLRHKGYSLILTSLKHRLNLIQNINPDFCLVIRFTKRFSKLSAENFFKYLTKRINIKRIVVGEDFVFGKDTEGNIRVLKKLGKRLDFNLSIVREFKIKGHPVRSEFIRDLIKRGNLKKARIFLNRDFSIYGKVIRGTFQGHILGYPTANIKTYQEIIPPCGVYFTKVILKGATFFGISNIGIRPTFYDTKKIVIEVHILDFKKDIYEDDIEIIFSEKIRKEKKFTNKKELIERIRKDELIARVLLPIYRSYL